MTAAAAPPPIGYHAGPFEVRDMIAHPSNYARTRRVPKLIVLHATHGSEGARSAENGAAEILRSGMRKSWHYMVDADSVVRSVRDEHRAWHCGKRGNALGIGIELCGRADQTIAQWYDAASLATLQLAVRLCRDLCFRWQLPPVLVDVADLHAGRPGITTHAMVSAAWRESDHTDPGPGFPLEAFVAAVARASVVLVPQVVPGG